MASVYIKDHQKTNFSKNSPTKTNSYRAIIPSRYFFFAESTGSAALCKPRLFTFGMAYDF
jgi:hypothetical protein